MKVALALLTLAILYSAESAAVFDRSLDAQWEHFKRVFQKSYPSHLENDRKGVWLKNVEEIIHHNLEYDLGTHSFRNGINEYADLSHHEFVNVMNGYRRSKDNSTASSFIPASNVVIPDTVDWRKEGLVTPVKNQGQCGSCWAFSTTGSLEGQHKKKTGKLVSLSEQNLVDCSGAEGNYGCEGGLMDQGFTYIKKNGGIDTEESYPYTAEDGTCHYKSSDSGATCTGYVDIPTGDESALQKAVATVGPVSVAIDASQFSFQLYSWGASWGENGYIRMSRNKNNQCGIATQASYPLV